jgi:hypothetical protein
MYKFHLQYFFFFTCMNADPLIRNTFKKAQNANMQSIYHIFIHLDETQSFKDAIFS